MLNIGDKVITETNDELTGMTGFITGLSQNQPAAYVTMEEDVDKNIEYDYSMFFLFTELRKVESA
ncbi:hypothetical protein ABZ154_09180 [Streptomyces sp. NPDC006261]|uniref:hypothetical protein n=1 Tax=Streptomyces sp. NPDC006261 TaxID=3156739 RepID=UPI0033B0B4B0